MTIVSPLLKLIREAQALGIRKENSKKENIMGQIGRFVADSRGFMTECWWVWVPISGGF